MLHDVSYTYMARVRSGKTTARTTAVDEKVNLTKGETGNLNQ